MISWKRYLDGAEGRELFRQERLRLPDGRSVAQALKDDPWQREPLAMIDDPRTRLAFVDQTRGGGKTTLCAWIAVERLVLRRNHDILVVSNDRDQARILSREANGFIARDEVLRRVCDPLRERIENKVNGSRLEVLSSDAVSAYGLGSRSTSIIIDEFWGAPNRELFDAMWSSVPKAPDSQLIALTNAGPDRDGIAWEIRELCRLSDDPALRFWASAEHNITPSWIDAEEIERQRRTLPHSVFARLWLGEWGHGSGDFLTREQVEECIDERLDPRTSNFAKNRRYYLGVDLGLRHDRSVIAVIHKERETVIVDHLATWHGTPEHPVSLEDVQAHLHMLGKRIPRLKRGLLDPWQAAMMLERARRAGLRTIEEMTFTPANIQLLSQTLWNTFRSGNIRIPPHAALIDELVTLRIVEKRYGWRIDHQAGGFSDHVIALGLALVAAIPETGEIAVDDERHQYFYDQFKSRVSAKMFGLGKRGELTLVDFPHAQPHPRHIDYYASIRFLQTLRAMDRISPQEAGVIEDQIRQAIWRNRDATRALKCITDGFDNELGSLREFVDGPVRKRETTQKGVSHEASH